MWRYLNPTEDNSVQYTKLVQQDDTGDQGVVLF